MPATRPTGSTASPLLPPGIPRFGTDLSTFLGCRSPGGVRPELRLFQHLGDDLLERRGLSGGPGGGKPLLAEAVLHTRHEACEIGALERREGNAAALSQRCRC